MLPFISPGTPVQTAYSVAMAANSGGNAGSSFRGVVTPTASGAQVRVTVNSGTAGPMLLNNVAIGQQSTTYNTTGTPVEIKFNGVSGTGSMSASTTLTSDWTNFPVVSGTPIVLIADVNSGVDNIGRVTTSANSYFIAATASYNTASPAGSWNFVNTDQFVFSKVEVRKAP